MKVTHESHLKTLLTPPGLSLESTDMVRKYHYVDLALSWFEARAHCREEFVDLATVTNQEDSDRLLKALQGGGSDAWIGLLDDQNNWKWTTQNMSFNSDKNYSNWEMGTLYNANTSKKCVLMKTSGAWLDLPCQEEHLSVCYDSKRGIHIKKKCGFKTNKSSLRVPYALSLIYLVASFQISPIIDSKCCGKFSRAFTERSPVSLSEERPDTSILVNDSMTWKDATKFCQTHHTHLVFVKNSSENERIASLLPADAWIGLSKTSWNKWSDGRRVSFATWAKGQPDFKERTVKSCAAADAATAMWRGDDCYLERPFICYWIQQTREVRVKLRFLSEANLQDRAVNQQILKQVK